MTKIFEQKDADFFINHLDKYHSIFNSNNRESPESIKNYFQLFVGKIFEYPVFQVSHKKNPNTYSFYNPDEEVLNYCKNNGIDYHPYEVSVLINEIKNKDYYRSASPDTYRLLQEAEKIIFVSKDNKKQIVKDLVEKSKSYEYLGDKTKIVKKKLVYSVAKFSCLVAAALIENNEKNIDVKDFFKNNPDVEKIPNFLNYFYFCDDTSIYKEIKRYAENYEKNISFVTEKDENLSLIKVNKLDIVNQFELSVKQVDMIFDTMKKQSSIISKCYIEQNEVSIFYKNSINLQDMLSNIFVSIKDIKSLEDIESSIKTIEQYSLLDHSIPSKAPDKSTKKKI